MAIELTHIIQQKAEETHQNVKKIKKVPHKTLEELAKAIKDLPTSSEEITVVNRSHIEKAIESLSAVDEMIANIKKETDIGLEEDERDEVVAPITYMPIPEMIKDLRKFLRRGQKVEKTYKPRTQQ